ncbi:MAG TPA: M28 family peptidase, partial [Aeromonadales bacterium]|nr:M28 family peptidase [Aeromonadales bacterium]
IVSMAKILQPLGITLGEKKAEGGPDFSPFHAQGLAVFDLKQDGTHYFDWHHTSNDTLDKIVPDEMAQNVAAFAVVVYLSAQYEGDFGSALEEK